MGAAAGMLLPPLASAQEVQSNEVGEHVILENIPPSVEDIGRDYSGHMRTRGSYSIRGWTHDGDALLLSRSGNLYRSKAARAQYTKILDYPDISINSAQLASVCGREGYVFIDDEDGDEYYSVYAGTRNAFEPAKLSPGKGRSRGVRISNDRATVGYAISQADSGVWDLLVQDVCGGSEPRTLYSGGNAIFTQDFHPSGGKLLATQDRGTQSVLIEYNLATGDGHEIVAEDSRISDVNYSGDGSYVFYTSNEGTEFRELVRLDRSSQEIITVIGGIGADIEGTEINADRSHMAIAINQLGLTSILSIDLNSLKLVSGPSRKPLGVVSSMHMSPDGTELALRLSQPTVPGRSGVYSLAEDSFKPWTGGFSPNQELIDLLPRITEYPTTDPIGGKKRDIPLLAYLPKTASADRPAPVLILAHGGPASQSVPSFSRYSHYLVSKMGIAVLRPNIRGSTGYGRTFEQADQVMKRGDAVRDIGALLDWIDGQPELDASRVVIGGGSYGGFVALASLAEYSDRLKGGYSSVGVTDFETFMKNTEANRVDNRRREYGDECDPEVAAFMKTISPLHNAAEITSPVLILQGANDPRVPQQQAEDMITAIRSNGVPVYYMLAKNEGHGFSESRNQRLSNGARIWFLKKMLFDQGQ